MNGIVSAVITSMMSSITGAICVVLWALGLLYLWPITKGVMVLVMLFFPPWPFVVGVGVIARAVGLQV